MANSIAVQGHLTTEAQRSTAGRFLGMKSRDRFESGANGAVIQVSGGVLHLEPVPRPMWDAEAVRYIGGGLVVAGHGVVVAQAK
jgi:hypothetical protein